jgi:O-antigen/teichoic acid export membrane protein
MTENSQATHPGDGPASADAGSESERLGKNLAALGAGQLFTWTMTLAWTLVVPRLLGPGDMGLITTGIAVAGILQIVLGAGTGLYIARELVVSPHRSSRLLVTAMMVRLLLVPFFMAAIFLWANLAHYSAEGKLVLYLSGGATVLYLLAEPAQSYFQALERMHYRALGDAINKAAQGLVGIVLTILGFGALGFAGCWLVMSGVVVVLSLRWAKRFVHLEWRTSLKDMRDVARGSLVYWTNGLFYMIYLWIDTAMLSVMTNPTVVGWYGVPTKLFQTMMFLPTMVGTAWLPRLVRASERSRHEMHVVARTPVALILGLAVPISAIVAISASPVINLVYGHAYAQAVPVLVILGVGLVPMYLSIILGSICVAAGKQIWWTYLMAGATIVNPALNAVLIPMTQHRFHNGAIGAAIALVGTEAIVTTGGIFVIGRQVLGVATLKRVARAGVASVGMCGVVFATRSAGPYVSLGAGGVALIVLGYLCGAVTREERRQIGAFGLKLAGRFGGPLSRLSQRQRAARPDQPPVPVPVSVPVAAAVATTSVPASVLAPEIAASSASSRGIESHVSFRKRKVHQRSLVATGSQDAEEPRAHALPEDEEELMDACKT